VPLVIVLSRCFDGLGFRGRLRWENQGAFLATANQQEKK